jgi:hypothetical protein
MNPGETFTAAARRLHEATSTPPLKRVITAYAYGGSFPQKYHAIIDNPDARARMAVGNLVIQGRALCGNRGGSIDYGGWRLVSAPGDNMNRHSGVDFTPEDTGYCQDCVIAWREQFQLDAKETKACSRCERDLPLNKFRPHKGRKDGLASECEDAAAQPRLMRKRRGRAAERPPGQRRAVAARWLDIVNDWQRSTHLKPFTCSAGHELDVEVTEKGHDVGLSWRCSAARP